MEGVCVSRHLLSVWGKKTTNIGFLQTIIRLFDKINISYFVIYIIMCNFAPKIKCVL